MVVVSMHYYGFCIYFSITIWDGMDIVDYLDCQDILCWLCCSLWLLFAPRMIKCLEYIMMSLFVTVDAPKTRETLVNFFCETIIILHC